MSDDYTKLIEDIGTTLSDSARCHSLRIQPAWYGLERDLGKALVAIKTLHARLEATREVDDSELKYRDDVLIPKLEAERDALRATLEGVEFQLSGDPALWPREEVLAFVRSERTPVEGEQA